MKRILVASLCLLSLVLVGSMPSLAAPESMPGPTAPKSEGHSKSTTLTPEQKERVAYLIRAAKEFYVRKNFDAAVMACQEALKMDPTNMEAYDVFGKVLVSTGNWALTIRTLETQSRLSDNPYYARTLAQVCNAYDMPIQEIRVRERLARLEPTDVGNYTRLAILYERLNLAQEVVLSYERALKVKPGDPILLKALAEAYQGTGKPQDRVRALARLVAVEPSAENRTMLARASAESDDPRKGLALYEKLLAEHPGDADYQRQVAQVTYDIGNMYYDHCMYATADQYYRKVRSLGIGDTTQMWKAQKLLHPSLAPIWETGQSADNRYTFTDVFLNVPMHGPDLTLRANYGHRYLKDVTTGAAAGTDVVRLFADYSIWKDWRAVGMIGTTSHGMVGAAGAQFKTDPVDERFGYTHDFVLETPLAVGTGLNYNGLYSETQWRPFKRWQFGLDVYAATYSNSNNSFQSNLSAGWSAFQEPDHYELQLKYTRSDLRDKFAENPLLRFGPIHYGTNNLSLSWEHRPIAPFVYKLEYTRTIDDGGNSQDSYLGRIDWAIATGSSLFAQYERGGAARGAINPGTFNQNTDYRITVGTQVTF